MTRKVKLAVVISSRYELIQLPLPIQNLSKYTLVIGLWSLERSVFKCRIIHTVYQWPFPEYFCLVLIDTRPLPELNSNNIRPWTSSTEKNWVGCVSLSVAYNRRPSSDRARKVTPTTKLKKSIKLVQVMPYKLNLKKEFSQVSYRLIQNSCQRSIAG